MEIVSFPGPDRLVTLEGLRTFHVTNRHYRNRRIGEFLKEIHLTEGRNTGFRKTLRALEHNGSPAARVRDRRGAQLLHHAFAPASGVRGDDSRPRNCWRKWRKWKNQRQNQRQSCGASTEGYGIAFVTRTCSNQRDCGGAWHQASAHAATACPDGGRRPHRGPW